ncbi:hypothetical protein [Nocardioides flavescens]|uniref:Uncharacterized protein n=1 Tax=Nocardioides flavescens TaxID=2691959 RepID=A0A6L7F1F3_9ACTN|nr:hypothetical protein [Nocardioides flavescens]MXG91225.1 hypothetical protein [Nocardioides flavescens]
MRRTLSALVTPLVGTGLALGLATLAPAAAHADAAASGGETFSTGAAGWTGSTATSGVCLPAVLCPTVSATYAAGGGAGGATDGYLRTGFAAVANTLLATTTATWTSPAFAYTGVAGAQPADLTVDLSRRAELGALLPVDVANTSSFRVDLVDQATGTAVTAVDAQPLPRDTGWTTVPTAHVDPSLLTIGRDYAVRITTTYTSAATVTAAGEVGYDDVKVAAIPVPPVDPPLQAQPPVVIYPGPTPTAAAPATPGTPAQVGLRSTRELRQFVRNGGLPGRAKLVGDRITFKVGCPPQSLRTCRWTVQGLVTGDRTTTSTSRRTLRVAPGRAGTVRLTVRPAYRSDYARGQRISVRATVRAGVYKVTVVKRIRLR